MREAMAALCLIFALSIALVGGSCSRKPAAKAPPGAATVTLGGGENRTGFLFGSASDRGVLVIAADDNTDAWTAIATELGRLGYRTLVIGHSAGSAPAAVRSATAALERSGAQRIVYVGSGASIAAALQAAAGGASGVATLNPPGEPEPVPADGMPPVALLAMASLADGPSSAAAQRLYNAAAEPRTLALYPAREAAPVVFGAVGGELKTAFLDFLRTAFQPLSARSAR